MHLLCCEHPQRVYNRYINEYITVPCGTCNSCKNRKARKWVDLLECERRNSRYTFFVTLTYDESNLPHYYFRTFGSDESHFSFNEMFDKNVCLYPMRYAGTDDFDFIKEPRALNRYELRVKDLSFESEADKELFYSFLGYSGIPYASKLDIQKFHKRLNKFFHDNVTNCYKNFRYFVVSEYGSTTLRPHFHGIYFINDSNVQRRFQEGILSSWRFGRIDCQLVTGSACNYVAQYINKLADLPSFYKASALRPFFVFSRHPVIGNGFECTEDDEKIFNDIVVSRAVSKKDCTGFCSVSLDKATENRIFPKCFGFSTLPYQLRTELYQLASRFNSERFEEFRYKIASYLRSSLYSHTQLYVLLTEKLDNFSRSGIEWLRRAFYLSRRVLKNARRFGCGLFTVINHINEYWNKKKLYLLKVFYDFQSEYASLYGSEDLQLMYPEFLIDCGTSLKECLTQYEPFDVREQRETSAFYAFSNKRTHFKNMYLESIKDKNNFLYNILINFYNGKKRYEIVEALST